MKWWQIVLWPFSILYGSVMSVRNWLYDTGWWSSVGNLEIGGSGKSPFVDYLASELKQDYTIGILSRGYGRRSKGFKWVDIDADASWVGDESVMLKWKHPDAIIAVCEDRVKGINTMLAAHNHLDCIILDDAFQHRRLKAGYKLLLTQFARPFYRDYVLPAGRLREFECGKKRANAVVVTKTPIDISMDEKNTMMRQLGMASHQSAYFAHYVQGSVIQVWGSAKSIDNRVILVTGIAHDSGLKSYLSKSFEIIKHIANPDHYQYKNTSFEFLSEQWETNTVITTAKDWVKWQPYKSYFKGWNIYIAPIHVQIEQHDELINTLKKHIEFNKHGVR